jgi:hypothetical protein
LQVLPTFVVIGSMKGGTTSLAEYLGAHPEVFMATPKELDFFSNYWDCGPELYERCFEDAGAAKARGEASPRYSRAPKYPDVPSRMASLNPDLRLIYMLREPIARIRSMYAHWFDEGHEDRPLDVAVRDRPEYVDSARYAYQIELYLEHFDRSQLLVLDSNRLRTHRVETLREVFAFIGVDPDVRLANVDEEFNVSSERTHEVAAGRAVRNAMETLHLRRLVPRSVRARVRRAVVERPNRPPDTMMSPELEAEIRGALQPDLERLRTIVGPDFDLWGRA